MKITADARITFPRELVFSTYRDRLPELVPHLPNIRGIQVIKREDAPGGVVGETQLLNVWRAEADIPRVAQAFLKPDMVAWDDHAHWNQNDWSCDWRTVPKFFTDNVTCGGRNTYEAVSDTTTILHIRGHLDIDLRGVKGIPRFLAGRVAPVVEKFIVALLTPNLLSVSDGLTAFLDAEAAKKR